MMFRMEFGMEGDFSFSLILGLSVSLNFVNRPVILTIKEKARFSSKVIPDIWPRMLALNPSMMRGFSRILISSLIVPLTRSEADRIFLMVL